MKFTVKYVVLLVLLVSISVGSAIFCAYWTNETNKVIEQKAKETEERYNRMLEHIQAFDAKQSIEREQMQKVQQRLQGVEDYYKKLSFYGPTVNGDVTELDFDIYTDLKDNFPSLSAWEMDMLISEWYGGQGLAGRGQAFITAAEETGLNPIYLFAHAAVESGWGTSYLARTRGNMYGIGAYTEAPGNALYLGDEIDEGIVNGAIWINDNYYNQGACTLSDMKAYGYAEGGSWEHDIAYIVIESYNILGSII